MPQPAKPTRDEGFDSKSHLRRGLQVLEELAAQSSTAAEIGRRVGVNRSTALRILTDLVETGYVVRDERTKHFTIRSERFYGLIVNHPHHQQLMDALAPKLTALSSLSGEASLFAAPANGAMVYVAYYPSSQMVTLSERVGTVRPMHCSAVGKAYLSALEPGALDGELGTIDYSAGTEAASKGPIELRRRIELARETGYALDLDETFVGGSCVAVPFFHGDRLMGAIGVSGPTIRMSEERLHELGAQLLEHVGAEE